ncbi:hypothetical protein KVP04_05565 [Halobacterium salinarum]|nr:hypothetical protein [Halobacterium salinarum]MCF2168730.1 hypothetical protein [Halobacterium salinarum]MCF2238595.1 hypothetical protein [Halobacterium salinarum]QRY23458.1 hypothetical protein JT689_05370 [Halobacterium sp. GSL-19]
MHGSLKYYYCWLDGDLILQLHNYNTFERRGYSMSSGTEESLEDAVDRFERTLNHQIQIINEIDKKAEHVTRLIGLLVGAILSVLAVAFRINNGQVSPPNLPIWVAFSAGVFLLISSMTFSIITYLSSRFKIGLHYQPAQLLNQSDYDVKKEKHIRRVIGTYGHNLKKNKRVIEVNSSRFRYSLVSLLDGITFMSLSGILFIGSVSTCWSWVALCVLALIAFFLSWYILTGNYLTLDDRI